MRRHLRQPLDLLGGGTGDALGFLTVYVALLVCVPSRLVVGALGGAGTPAQLWGLLGVIAWIALPLRGRLAGQSVGIAMIVLMAAVVCSYVVATTRAIKAEELRAADTAVLAMLSRTGVLLVAADAVHSPEGLRRLLRRVVLAGGALATLGLLQFTTKQAYTNYIQIPGLHANSTLLSVLSRDGFTRPAGTALHAIEFGAVLTMILPFALHFAMHDRSRSAIRRWYPVAAIAVAVPISISRSAIVSTVVVLLVLIPTWPPRSRRGAYALIVALVGTLFVALPGLLGTLTNLFTSLSGDSSALSRSGSYSLAWQFITRNPILGRGLGTFLPEYRILDNQYLGLAIELGLVGVAAMLGLFATGIATAFRVRRSSADTETRQLAQAMIAAITAAACSFALFDTFSFPMAAGLMFLVLGLVGGLQKTTGTTAADARRLTSPGGR